MFSCAIFKSYDYGNRSWRRKNRLTGDPPRLTHNSQLFAVFDLNHNQPLMLSIAAKVKDVVSSIFS